MAKQPVQVGLFVDSFVQNHPDRSKTQVWNVRQFLGREPSQAEMELCWTVGFGGFKRRMQRFKCDEFANVERDRKDYLQQADLSAERFLLGFLGRRPTQVEITRCRHVGRERFAQDWELGVWP